MTDHHNFKEQPCRFYTTVRRLGNGWYSQYLGSSAVRFRKPDSVSAERYEAVLRAAGYRILEAVQ